MSKKSRNNIQLYDCNRCDFTFKKKDLRKQRGMLLCEACFDTVLEIEPVNVKWRSSRDNSTSIDPVTTPTVFTITTAGITAVGRSQTKTREGGNSAYEMQVVGLPTVVTAPTQIAPMPQGTLLVLQGTSDNYYVTIKAGNGTDLTSDMTLKSGNVLSLVYNATSALWCETSRS
jgi:hypothetical protein